MQRQSKLWWLKHSLNTRNAVLQSQNDTDIPHRRPCSWRKHPHWYKSLDCREFVLCYLLHKRPMVDVDSKFQRQRCRHCCKRKKERHSPWNIPIQQSKDARCHPCRMTSYCTHTRDLRIHPDRHSAQHPCCESRWDPSDPIHFHTLPTILEHAHHFWILCDNFLHSYTSNCRFRAVAWLQCYLDHSSTDSSFLSSPWDNCNFRGLRQDKYHCVRKR